MQKDQFEALKKWRLRFFLMAASMLSSGVVVGVILADLLPRIAEPAAYLALAVCFTANFIASQRHIRLLRAQVAADAVVREEMEQQHEEIMRGAELLQKARVAQEFRDSMLARVVVHEVDLDGELVPVEDPGLTALVMDQIADRMRQEALRRAAEENS